MTDISLLHKPRLSATPFTTRYSVKHDFDNQNAKPPLGHKVHPSFLCATVAKYIMKLSQ